MGFSQCVASFCRSARVFGLHWNTHMSTSPDVVRVRACAVRACSARAGSSPSWSTTQVICPDFDADIAKSTLSTNSFGAMRVSDVLGPHPRGGGTIVNVSSGKAELRVLGPERLSHCRASLGHHLAKATERRCALERGAAPPLYSAAELDEGLRIEAQTSTTSCMRHGALPELRCVSPLC